MGKGLTELLAAYDDAYAAAGGSFEASRKDPDPVSAWADHTEAVRACDKVAHAIVRELQRRRNEPAAEVPAAVRYAEAHGYSMDDGEVTSIAKSAEYCPDWGTVGRRKVANAAGALSSIEGLLRCRKGWRDQAPMTDAEVVAELEEELEDIQDVLRLLGDSFSGRRFFELEEWEVPLYEQWVARRAQAGETKNDQVPVR